MEVRINHSNLNPIRARVCDVPGKYLTLDFVQPNGNEVSLLLPPDMAEAVHQIVGVFTDAIGSPPAAIPAGGSLTVSPAVALAMTLGAELAATKIDDHAMAAVERRDLP